MQDISIDDGAKDSFMKLAGDLPDIAAYRAMLDATPDCVKIMSADGVLIEMSKSGCLALGVAENSVNGTPWIPLLPAPLHLAATEALALAASGVAARFPGHSDVSGNVIFWDNLLTPVVDENGEVQSIVCVSRDVTEKTLLEKKLQDALAREQLMSFEMQHRVKNVLTVVNAIVMMSEKEARSGGDPSSLGKIITGKLGALSRASDAVLLREGNEILDLKALIASVLRPFGKQCLAEGPDQMIPVEISNTLALCFYELATNSVKHGALSAESGGVTINWTSSNAWLDVNWLESGGPSIEGPPIRQGFGTHLIDRIVSAAGGAVVRNWFPAGLAIELKIPLKR